MLEAAAAYPDELRWAVSALNPKFTYAQNIPIVQHILTSPDLKAALLWLSYKRDALVLHIVGCSHQAWNMLGLSTAQRSNLLEMRRALWRHVMRPCLESLYCCTHMHSRSISIMGISTEVLVSDMSNIEGRMHLLALNLAMAYMLVERSLSSDNVRT